MNTNLFIANSSGSLTKHESVIKKAFDRAIVTAGDLLKFSTIDVICIDSAYRVIPETGMSGYTPNRYLIYLYVNPSFDLQEDELYYTFCHELHHAKRYEGPAFGENLFDSMITEGLAIAFEKEVSDGLGSFLSNYVEEKNNRELFDQVLSHFDDQSYDHLYWFINASENLPRWTGYRVGYYIVSQYLKKTNKKASDLVLEDSKVFREFARDGMS